MAWKFRRPDSPFWWIGYMHDGVERRVPTGTKSAKAADNIVNKMSAEIAEHKFGIRKATASEWTIEQLGKVYLDKMQRDTPRSDKWRRERWKVIEAALGAETPLEQIDQDRIDAFAEERLDLDRSVSTVKGEVHVIQHAIKWAWRKRKETGLSSLKIDKWKPPKNGPKKEPEAYTLEEARRIRKSIRDLVGNRFREVREGAMLAWTFIECGARPAEIYQARTRDLDARAGKLRLPGLKGGRWRTVTLPKDLVTALAHQARGSETLFPPSEMRPQERYKEAWRRIRETAKVTGAFYQLRHTFAAEFLRAGGDMRDLQYLMGHRSITTTEKYARFSPDYETRGVARLKPRRPSRARTGPRTGRLSA